MECTSAGWYPQPHIEWRGDGGERLPAIATSQAADGEGLHVATSSVILNDNSGKWVSCVVRNPLLSQEKTARVSIAGECLAPHCVQLWPLGEGGLIVCCSPGSLQ